MHLGPLRRLGIAGKKILRLGGCFAGPAEPSQAMNIPELKRRAVGRRRIQLEQPAEGIHGIRVVAQLVLGLGNLVLGAQDQLLIILEAIGLDHECAGHYGVKLGNGEVVEAHLTIHQALIKNKLRHTSIVRPAGKPLGVNLLRAGPVAPFLRQLGQFQQGGLLQRLGRASLQNPAVHRTRLGKLAGQAMLARNSNLSLEILRRFGGRIRCGHRIRAGEKLPSRANRSVGGRCYGGLNGGEICNRLTGGRDI